MNKIDYINKNVEPQRLVLEKEREQKPSDIYDIIHEITKVHEIGPNLYQLSQNHILAEYPQGIKEFILKEHLLASQAYNYIKDKEEAKLTEELMRSEIEAHAILNRNSKSNALAMAIIKRLTDEDIPEPSKPAGIVDKVKKLFGVNKKDDEEMK